jgi:hypothetical protein
MLYTMETIIRRVAVITSLLNRSAVRERPGSNGAREIRPAPNMATADLDDR